MTEDNANKLFGLLESASSMSALTPTTASHMIANNICWAIVSMEEIPTGDTLVNVDVQMLCTQDKYNTFVQNFKQISGNLALIPTMSASVDYDNFQTFNLSFECYL